jgi:hypothetical protein
MACKIWIWDIEWMGQILGKGSDYLSQVLGIKNDWWEPMVHGCLLLKNG